ncbi:hypothetical protein Tco_1287161, partial [Tanacetum coccineum]
MLEPVKVKCIFLGYRKGIVGNKLWRLDDVTSKVVLYRNMGFNESKEYKKTFIGSGVGMRSIQVLQGVEFEDLIYYHLVHDREQHLACKLFGYREDSNEAAFAVAVVEKIYAPELLTFNDTVACEVISKKSSEDRNDYYWEYTPGIFIHLFLYIDDMVFLADARLRSRLPRFYNGKLVQTLLKGHSILSLEGSLSGDCDVEKNGKWSCIYAVGCQEYLMVCTRLDIASADVGILDKFNRGLQTNVQVFVDFDYAIAEGMFFVVVVVVVVVAVDVDVDVAVDVAVAVHLLIMEQLEDTSYLCLHFTRNHEDLMTNTSYPEDPIRCIKDRVLEDSGRYQMWFLLQEIPNTPIEEKPK